MECVMSLIESAAIAAIIGAEEWLAIAAVLFGLAAIIGVLASPLVAIMLVLMIPISRGVSVIGLGENVKSSFRFGLWTAAAGIVGLVLTGSAYLAYILVLP